MTTELLSRPGRTTVPHATGFWLTAYAFAVTMAFSAVPTPLYVDYQQRDHFSAATVTVVFAVYALGVAVSLLLVGHVSDRLGRRRVLVPAVLLSVAAGVVFLLWPALPGLLLARVLQGFAVGAITATATVHLAELHRAARPDAGPRRAEVVAVAANLGGIGLGPLVSGLLADVAADPLRLPYLVVTALLAVAAIGLALVPETAPAPADPGPYRPQRVRVPAAERGLYAAAALTAFAALAVFGLFTSIAPTLLTEMLGAPSHALTGAAAFVTFAAGATGQVLLSRRPPRRTLPAGAVAVAAGLALLVVSVDASSPAGFLLGGVVAGAGAGLLFAAAVAIVSGLAGATGRAEALAGLFLAGYVGLAVPVLGLGLATRVTGLSGALLAFAVVVGALGVGSALAAVRRLR
ncbi:MFS transporter [Jiangella anatolica]|uniref:MFS transporter n=1 Tax=Jiangella anatolica TaxID=2670374 RepID=A0A2W2CS85_9ACTN|nr:MFS transporter [Jiangella anatolica]PZF83063.1 MFS transporter [Jiangella anatolica]